MKMFKECKINTSYSDLKNMKRMCYKTIALRSEV